MPASEFTIRELTGRARRVVLRDRALPYQPFTLEDTQRVSTNWLPGYTEATVTMLGAALAPTTVNGKWKDKYIAQTGGTFGTQIVPASLNGSAIASVRDLVEIVTSIRAEGQLLEVTWNGLVRRGVITKFRHSWFNIHDVEFEIEFTWVSNGDPAANPVPDANSSVSDTASLLRRQMQTLNERLDPDFELDPDVFGEVNSALGKLESAVQDAQNIITNSAQQVLNAADAARRMVAIANSVIEYSSDIIRIFDGVPPRYLDIANNGVAADIGSILNTQTYANAVKAACRDLRRTVSIRRDVSLQSLERDLQMIYRAKEGDDLRDVSRLAYGTPFEWRRLLLFNALETPRLAVGQVVLVPRITVGG